MAQAEKEYFGTITGPDGRSFDVSVPKGKEGAQPVVRPLEVVDAPAPPIEELTTHVADPAIPFIDEAAPAIEALPEQIEESAPALEEIDEKSFVDKFFDQALHGTKIMASGLMDAALMPSKLIAPVVNSIMGDNALTRGNEAWDAARTEFVGKSDKDYNLVENMLHFGGQLVPTPGLSASAAKTATDLGARALEAVTPLIASKGLSLTQMGANVALPTAIVEGVKSYQANENKRDVLDPEHKKKWLEENSNALLGAAAVGATRGKFRSSMGITGKKAVSEVSAISKAEQALFDANAPLKKLLPAAQVARIETTIPPSAMSSRIIHTMKTAMFPNSSVRLQHLPNAMLQVWAKMADDQRKMANLGLRAADDLDGRANNLGSVFPNKTDAELRGMIQVARADPVVMRWMDAHKQMMGDVRRYMLDRGLIDQDKYLELLTTQSNYVSRIGALIKDNSLKGRSKRVVDALVGKAAEYDQGLSTIQQLQHRGPKTTSPYEELVDAGTALEQTISNVIRLAETMAIRRSAVQWLTRLRTSTGERMAERVKSPTEANVSVLSHGEWEHYFVRDPTIALILQFAPQHTHLLVNNVRHVFQMFTTGPVADALSTVFVGFPMQSVANAFYESVGIMGQAYKHSKFNPVDAIIALPSGIAMSMKAAILERLARGAEEALLMGSPAAQRLTQQSVMDAADAYARTIVGTMERQGGAMTATTTTKEFDTMRSLAAAYAPTYYRETNSSFVPDPVRALWNTWMNAHDAVQLAWKHHYALRNMPGNASNTTEQRVANEVARVTGDFRQKGEPNQVVSLLRDATPYGNVILQSMYAWVRGFKNNPSRAVTFLTGAALAEAAMISWQMIDNPQLAQFYWNELTPEQRAQGIPIWQDPSNPRAVQFLTYPQEPRPFLAASREAFGTAMGFKDGSIYQDKDMLRALSDIFDKPWLSEDLEELRGGIGGAVGQVVGDVPLGAGIPGAALAAGGYRWSGDRGLLAAPESKQEVEGGTEFVNDPHSRRVYDILRSTLGMSGQLLVALDRGFAAVGQDATFTEKVANAYEHGQEVYKQRAQKLTGLLGMDHRVTTLTTTFKQLQRKADKIDMLPSIAAELKSGGTTTNVNPKIGQPLDVPHDSQFTVEAITASQAIPPIVMKQYTDLRTQRAQVYEKRDKLQNSAVVSAEEKARLTNEYNRAINRYNAQMLIVAEDMERLIGQKLKRPFVFEEFRVRR